MQTKETKPETKFIMSKPEIKLEPKIDSKSEVNQMSKNVKDTKENKDVKDNKKIDSTQGGEVKKQSKLAQLFG